MQRPPLLQHWRLCPGLPLPNSGARESADLCCLVFSMVFTAVLSRPCSWWPWRPNRSLWCKGRVLACIRCMPLFQGQLAPAPCILSATILLMSMSSQGYIGDACQTCGTFVTWYPLCHVSRSRLVLSACADNGYESYTDTGPCIKVPLPSCFDGVMNGLEYGVDCGQLAGCIPCGHVNIELPHVSDCSV